MARLHFVWSDGLAPAATAISREHEEQIAARLPNVEIRHTGGTSVGGVLTGEFFQSDFALDAPS